MTISVVLATRNEEINLERCLKSVENLANEIIIADSGSTDNTVKIAKKFNAKVINVSHQQNFHINKNIAIDNASMDWVLNLDADEEVSAELQDEIIQRLNNPNNNFNGYWINRRNWFLDRFLTKGGQYPDPTLRLYKRGKGRLPAKDVHEQAQVEGPIGNLKNDLLHYRDTSFEKYLEGFNRYSSFMSMQYLNSKLGLNLYGILKYLFVKPGYIFLNIFLRHRGYVDGKAGFIFSLYSSWVPAVAYIKYWQRIKFKND